MRSFIAIAAIGLAAYAVSAASTQDTPMAAQKPTPAHEKLRDSVGTWDAVVETGGQQSKGTETCALTCEGFWLESEFKGDVMGGPYHGKGFTGVDMAGKYVGVWVDSMGGPMAVMKDGEFSKDGKTLTQVSEGVDEAGKPAKFSYKTIWDGKDKRTFEMGTILPDGKTQNMMTIRYTRKK